MAKKSHLSWHDIELYLKEKIGKRELIQKKDHYINELNEIKKDLLEYKKDENLYKVEYSLYKAEIDFIFPTKSSLRPLISPFSFSIERAKSDRSSDDI